jgi:hypothetical protein
MSFVLSCEDLQAMERVVGIWLPAFAYQESVERAADLDMAAVADLAEAFREAVLGIEVIADHDGAVTQYALSESTSRLRAQMQALARGQVLCSAVSGSLIDAVASLCALPTDASTGGPVWTVAAGAYKRCGDLAEAGDEEGAMAALVSAGVAEATAKAWAAALCGRGSTASVTVARRLPGGRLEAGELRWIADTLGGAWRITGSAQTPENEPVYVMSPVKGAGLYQALAELCGGQRV